MHNQFSNGQLLDSKSSIFKRFKNPTVEDSNVVIGISLPIKFNSQTLELENLDSPDLHGQFLSDYLNTFPDTTKITLLIGGGLNSKHHQFARIKTVKPTEYVSEKEVISRSLELAKMSEKFWWQHEQKTIQAFNETHPSRPGGTVEVLYTSQFLEDQKCLQLTRQLWSAKIKNDPQYALFQQQVQKFSLSAMERIYGKPFIQALKDEKQKFYYPVEEKRNTPLINILENCMIDYALTELSIFTLLNEGNFFQKEVHGFHYLVYGHSSKTTSTLAGQLITTAMALFSKAQSKLQWRSLPSHAEVVSITPAVDEDEEVLTSTSRVAENFCDDWVSSLTNSDSVNGKMVVNTLSLMVLHFGHNATINAIKKHSKHPSYEMKVSSNPQNMIRSGSSPSMRGSASPPPLTRQLSKSAPAASSSFLPPPPASGRSRASVVSPSRTFASIASSSATTTTSSRSSPSKK